MIPLDDTCPRCGGIGIYHPPGCDLDADYAADDDLAATAEGIPVVDDAEAIANLRAGVCR